MRAIKESDNARPKYDIVIIGGGPAGLSAGIYAMRAAMKTVLIEKGAPGGQMAINKGVENYPGFIDINGFELSDRFLDHAKAYGLEILREEAVAIEPGMEFHTVRLANGATINSYALICLRVEFPEPWAYRANLKIWDGEYLTAPPVTAFFSAESPWPWWEAATPLWRRPSTCRKSLAKSISSIAGTNFGQVEFCNSGWPWSPRSRLP